MDSNAASAGEGRSRIGAAVRDEVRESLLLMSVSVAVTAAVTIAAQAALNLLG